jgi:hypothetical protein
MKELLAKAMGADKELTEDQALAAVEAPDVEADSLIAQVQATVETVNTAVAIQETAPTPVAEVVYNKAYDITFDENTRRYMLHTIEYTDKGQVRYAGCTEFARYLPEASHHLNKMMLDKLIPTMAPNWKPKHK